MDMNRLMDTLASSRVEVPSEVDVLEVRRASIEDQHARLRKMLKVAGEACARGFDRGQWETREDLTLVRLPRGARAELFHASGAVRFVSGTAPMDRLFKDTEPKKQLIERADRLFGALGLSESLGRGERLSFERLWQIKAAGSDREGKQSDPVLCRAIGAYRHHIEGIPVLGPASVAVHVDGEGELDAYSTLLRSPGGSTLERTKVSPVERAARQIVQQVAAQFDARPGRAAHGREFTIDCPAGLQFGYLSLHRRKVQRLLAPVFVAVLDVQHEEVRQGMVQIVAATEKSYLPLNPPGQESPTPATSKLNGKRRCG